jgi:outer membrane receptor protein involved in Fe transport
VEDELVYVGDEGIVESNGKTRRSGVDLSARYQFNKWLFADFNINLARPRSLEKPKEQDYLPLAPTITSNGGLSWKMQKGFNGSLRYRYIKNRPANEDNTIIAHGYFVGDLSFNYTQKKHEFGFVIENLFNAKWNEAQFATESRLKNEIAPVEEIHFTPGTPFALRFKIAFFL